MDLEQHLVEAPEAGHNHRNSDLGPVAVAAVERNLQSSDDCFAVERNLHSPGCAVVPVPRRPKRAAVLEKWAAWAVHLERWDRVDVDHILHGLGRSWAVGLTSLPKVAKVAG